MRTDRLVSAAALGALLTLAVAGACSSDEKNAAADVTVTQCVADPEGGRPTAEGEITNHSSKDSGYAFGVVFSDAAGNRVSQGAVTVADVAPGATATWRATGVARARGPLQCRVTNVVRTAVP